MNPAQYKQAMQQRQLERRAELLSKGESLSFTYPPPTATTRAGKQDGLVSVLQLYGEDSEGSSTATSRTSSTGGGALIEMFGVQDSQHGQVLLNSTGDGLSLLTPGLLSGCWSGPDDQLAGFDKQEGTPNLGTGSSVENDFGFDNEWNLQQRQQERGVRVLDWDDKLPGETSITQGVRLYLSNVYPDASHEDNCALFLRQILEHVAAEELDVPTLKTRHIIKIEAFLRLVVLSVPARTWQQSVRGAFSRTAAPAEMNASAGQVHQISRGELMFRMSLFVAMMKADRDGAEQVDIALDAMRVECVVRGYAANAAEILPLQRPARTLLPPLLYCMACELLQVRLLALEIRQVCRQIVSDYEARAKLWMSPAQNAERFLHPLVTEFASWLRSNRDILYQGSATEGLLRSIHEGLRSSLKSQVYRSPEHFLEVLKSLSSRLTDMPLPSYDPSGGDDHPFDVSQTLKDVSRERFDVNNVPTEPSRCWSQIRALLLKAAVLDLQKQKQQQHQRTLDRMARPPDAATVTVQPDTRGGGIAPNAAAAASASSAAAAKPLKPEEGIIDEDAGHLTVTSIRGTGKTSGRCAGESSPDTMPGDIAAGNSVHMSGGAGAGDEDEGGLDGTTEKGTMGDVVKDDVGGGGDDCGAGAGDGAAAKSALETYVDQCAWRVLHAASRTASGGDCFFVVQDLFGGEGVLVKMATAATEPIRICIKGLTVRVTTVDKHDIYHISDVDMTTSEAPPRPLMTITTTMKEVIQFAPFIEHPVVTRNKSGLIRLMAGRTGFRCGSSTRPIGPIEQQQPSNARSGRFITISACLPDYPEDHLDASAGVLLATSSCKAPLPDAEQAAHVHKPPSIRGSLPDDDDAVTSWADRSGDASASSVTSSQASITTKSSSNVLRRRPSVFSSPPPLPTPSAWKRREGSDSDSESSGSSAASYSGEASSV